MGHDLVLNKEHVNSAANDTFDKSGIAKNAREEKIRARDVTTAARSKQDAENAQMAKLYREHVLGEKPVEGIVSLDCHPPRLQQRGLAHQPPAARRARRRGLSMQQHRAFRQHKQRPPAGAAFGALQP